VTDAAAAAVGRGAPAEGSMSDSLFVACALAWASALVHVVAAFDHLGESRLFAALFVLSAVLQFAAGWAMYRRPSRRVLAFTVVLSVGIAAVWLMSRTVGLPIGPEHWTPEEIGPLDVISTADELALPWLVAVYARRTPRPLAVTANVAGGALVVVSALAFMLGHAH
jgi:predicted branched-subunit amino acid permease